MRRQLVIGNWKMNGSSASSSNLLSELLVGLNAGRVDAAEMAVCVPYVYLSAAADAIKGSSLKLGAQNVSQFDSGAYTGEVSPSMLADLGCHYVLVGHSERRSLFGESSQIVAEKFVAAQASGLTPVLCVGETLEEREAGSTLAVVESQIAAVIESVGPEGLLNSVIAYEPVWAIGTGLTATPEQAQEVHQYIRRCLGEAGEKICILYGGSVKASSAGELFAQADIDGGLVGGASLQGEEFLAIGQAAK